MHEYTITESILAIVRQEAAQCGGGAVTRIRIVIGELSTFAPESIDFYFGELAKGTEAAGAELVFERTEARAVCGSCGAEFRPSQRYFACPGCDWPLYELKQGQELLVDSIEIAETNEEKVEP